MFCLFLFASINIMPFRYKTKVGSTRKKITKQELQNAIEEVKSGVSLRKTAIKYNIDRTTLRRYTKNEQNLRKLDDKGSSYKASQIFTIAEEKLDRIFNKFVEL